MKGSIGYRVKALRTVKDMTLAELGEKLNLSTSYMSQIERDRINPSLTTLMNIARVLEVDPRYFFESGDDTALVTRSDQVIEPEIFKPNMIQYPLSPQDASNRLHVFRVVILPNSSAYEFDTYNGEEMCFVLDGELTVEAGEEIFILIAGDSIHYDALLPHSWSNRSDQICELIWSRASY
jgi:transcriptional regulator with XRE-family HTH domain